MHPLSAQMPPVQPRCAPYRDVMPFVQHSKLALMKAFALIRCVDAFIVGSSFGCHCGLDFEID
jgi:hypothetical protein